MAKKRKRRLKFRGEIIFLSFMLTFILCFIAYVNDVKELESSATPVINNNIKQQETGEQGSEEKKDNSKKKNSQKDNSEVQLEEVITVTNDEGETVTVTAVSEENNGQELENVEETDSQPSASVENPVAESSKADESYLDKCVFVGDSISTGFSGYGFVSEKNVFAKTSMRIDTINNTPLKTFYGDVLVANAIKAAQPENVYVMLGSNGMGWIETSKMMQDYNTFIDSVKEQSPDVNIYVMAIPPVTAEREQISSVAEGKILNSDINDYNSQLLELANEKGIYYIDVNSALVNSDGKLPSDVSTDGMHFNKETYIKVIDYILTHVAG